MADLISIDEYKLIKSIVKTVEDDKISSLITSASALIKAYCGITFIDHYTTPKTEYITNLNPIAKVLLLKEWPVNTISSVEILDNATGFYVPLDASAYYLDRNTDSIVSRTYWPVGEAIIKIVYTGGYEETPEDVKLATIDLVNHYHKEEFKERRSIGDASLDYATGGRSVQQPKWPNHIMRVLEIYKNG